MNDVNWQQDYERLLQREQERVSQESQLNSSMISQYQELCTTNISTESSTKNQSLDSSIKKTTAFVRRLKSLTSDSFPSLIQDAKRLNLSKFAVEVASSIGTSKLNHKNRSDFSQCTTLCSILHQYYAAFSPELLSHLLTSSFSVPSFADIKSLPSLKYPIPASFTRVDPNQRRATVRLLFELYSAGIFPPSKVDGSIVSVLERMFYEDSIEVKGIQKIEISARGKPGAPGSDKQLVDATSASCLFNLPTFMVIIRSFGDFGKFELFRHVLSESEYSQLLNIVDNYSKMLIDFAKHSIAVFLRVSTENDVFVVQKVVYQKRSRQEQMS
ncbi:hypothetical protein GEMRC1_012680 [Eukaryota sp. GEM-RC1]